MSSSASTTLYLLDQLATLAPRVRVRKMFGDYALYCDDKVVGLVCDDQLFIKDFPETRAMSEGGYTLAPPYRGARDYLLLDDSVVEDRARLSQLVTLTSTLIPINKKKPKV